MVSFLHKDLASRSGAAAESRSGAKAETSIPQGDDTSQANTKDEFYFSHRGVSYHISTRGISSLPPLILLHGFAQSGQAWADVACELAHHHFVIVPDLIGHGRSDRPLEPALYEMPAIVEWLAAFIDFLGFESTDLLGYSMGGRIALSFAAAHPKYLSSLILEGAGLGQISEKQREAMRERDSYAISILSHKDIEAFVDYWESLPVFATQKYLPQEARKKIRAERVANDPRALEQVLSGIGQHTMPDLAHILHSLTVPTLYIAGKHDNKYAEIARWLSAGKESKHLKTAIISAGHNTHLEAPSEFCACIDEFYH